MRLRGCDCQELGIAIGQSSLCQALSGTWPFTVHFSQSLKTTLSLSLFLSVSLSLFRVSQEHLFFLKLSTSHLSRDRSSKGLEKKVHGPRVKKKQRKHREGLFPAVQPNNKKCCEHGYGSGGCLVLLFISLKQIHDMSMLRTQTSPSDVGDRAKQKHSHHPTHMERKITKLNCTLFWLDRAYMLSLMTYLDDFIVCRKMLENPLCNYENV